MIEDNEIFDDISVLPFVIKPEKDPAQGQVQFCHNLFVILYEKSYSSCKQEFPKIRKKKTNS